MEKLANGEIELGLATSAIASVREPKVMAPQGRDAILF